MDFRESCCEEIKVRRIIIKASKFSTIISIDVLWLTINDIFVERWHSSICITVTFYESCWPLKDLIVQKEDSAKHGPESTRKF